MSDPRDILAQLIRVEAGKTGAGALAERMIVALDAAGWAVVPKGLSGAQWTAAKKHADSNSSATAFYEAAVEAGRVKP